MGEIVARVGNPLIYDSVRCGGTKPMPSPDAWHHGETFHGIDHMGWDNATNASDEIALTLWLYASTGCRGGTTIDINEPFPADQVHIDRDIKHRAVGPFDQGGELRRCTYRSNMEPSGTIDLSYRTITQPSTSPGNYYTNRIAILSGTINEPRRLYGVILAAITAREAANARGEHPWSVVAVLNDKAGVCDE